MTVTGYWRPTTPIRPPLVTTCVIASRGDTLTYRRVDADEMWIGRDRTRDQAIVVDDVHVARLHAKLRRTPAGLTVVDAHSENGTRVVRELAPGEAHLLHVGDTILLGESSISFVHELPEYPDHPDDVRSLFAAICASPDDNEPRLVLADLLTSHGDPRGEFISCQIAAEEQVNREAAARADELLAEHEFAWLAPLPVPVVSWSFRRGFVDCVWIRRGESVIGLPDHHPIRAVVEV
jgi:uncharacterized protein (TIGR02996 family)